MVEVRDVSNPLPRRRVVLPSLVSREKGNFKEFGFQAMEKWITLEHTAGEIAKAVEVNVGRTFSKAGSFMADIGSGEKLEKFRMWLCEESVRNHEIFGIRRNRHGRPQISLVASTSASLQSRFLASTAASLGNTKWRRHGLAETMDGTVNCLSAAELLKRPVAIVSLVPREVALFFAGAIAGAAAKTVTAPLDRVKLLMQVHGVQAAQAGVKKGIGFLEAILKIGVEEGVRGYWKGNLPQVIRVIPYSAVQLFAYETYKKLLKGDNEELPVLSRLAAGACAGMTSTLVTYPLDVLRLRMAIDPAAKSMGQVALSIMKEEGFASFYRGLGPSLLGIAPYIALNFCVFDLVKKALPEDIKKRPEASFLTALASATFATTMCYPLDTVRRQLQMKGTPFKSVADAIPGIVARDGFLGLYRGFLPNALKNLPNNSIRLTTFDAAKNLISLSQSEYDKLLKVQQEASTSS
ncbi:hypothetical protein R1sor_014268 [Riccia sorocarpa]|uniref:Uncharacterized protein n=1 Tax=Riccia sorocarpa TaxID=122646 RepID=A0ABD3HBS2_9MARC